MRLMALSTLLRPGRIRDLLDLVLGGLRAQAE